MTTPAPKPRRFTVSQADAEDGTLGICLKCGEIANGVEPDARKYECDACGAHRVYGIEEAMISEYVDLASEDDEEDSDDE